MNFLNWFLDPVKHHYADFEGRTTRQQFWMFVLVAIIISLAISIVETMVGVMFLSALFSLAILVPNLAIGARRLHDTGMSGWWQLLFLIPFLGLVIMIILFARKGEAGSNEYGPAPAGAETQPSPIVSEGEEPTQSSDQSQV